MRHPALSHILCFNFVPPTKVIPSVGRVVGIEPTHQPWEGRRLPLHHTRVPQRPVPFVEPIAASYNHYNTPRVASCTGGISSRAKVTHVAWVYAIPPWLFSIIVIAGMC